MCPESWKSEFFASIKCIDTEEKLDLYFYRPIGFLIARISRSLSLTPTHLTLFGMLCGVASGVLIYFQPEEVVARFICLMFSAGLLILAGIFDSSDGQLARMTKQSSRVGLVLDGICDNIVFGSVYLGSLGFTLKTGTSFVEPIWLILLLLLAGFFHSWQCAALDFFNREYLYFGALKGDGYWNPSVSELNAEIKKNKQTQSLSRFEILLEKSRLTWLIQQSWSTRRSEQERLLWKQMVTNSSWKSKWQSDVIMSNAYIDTQRSFLPKWRLIGTNAHTFWFLLFLFIGKFEYYLLLIDVVGFSLILICLRAFQNNRDQLLRLRISPYLNMGQNE